VQSLGTSAANVPAIANVQLIGTDEKLAWKQTPEGLRVELPKRYQPKTDFTAALKVSLT